MSNELDNPQYDDDMLPEYDFSEGIRGKHYKAMQQGYKIIIHKMDGTTEIHDYTLPEGAVMLDPDVRPYFPNGDAVNTALRGLIKLIPQKQVTSEAES